jgi:predicted DNA-binding antitoxin AbrB/MazE fold protein
MLAIPAVYEGGVFRPTVPVHLAEGTAVSVTAPETVAIPVSVQPDDGMDAIYEILSHRYRSGHHDTAERHNEHQP